MRKQGPGRRVCGRRGRGRRRTWGPGEEHGVQEKDGTLTLGRVAHLHGALGARAGSAHEGKTTACGGSIDEDLAVAPAGNNLSSLTAAKGHRHDRLSLEVHHTPDGGRGEAFDPHLSNVGGGSAPGGCPG